MASKKEMIAQVEAEIISERNSTSDSDLSWERHLRTNCMGDITRIQTDYPQYDHVTVPVDRILNNSIWKDVLDHPDILKKDIVAVIKRNHSQMRLGENSKIEIRFINVTKKRKVRDLRVDDEGKLVAISCLVKRRSSVYHDVTASTFKCEYDKTHLTTVAVENGVIEPPKFCSKEGCKSKNLKLDMDRDIKRNAQNLYVQDPLEELEGGCQPESIRCKVIGKLTDIQNQVSIGDRVIINGILRALPKYKDGKMLSERVTFIEVNNIERSQSDYEEIKISEADEKQIKEIAAMPDCFDHIAKSIAPSIHGQQLMKQAVALQLFEGVSRVMPDGTIRRGHINILIVGDPSLGKTVVLTSVKSIAPRCVLANATTASKVGLIASVIKDEMTGQYVLDAGAYMLANGGILCLDEASELGKEDMKVLGEAMEQGCVHINKAGINAEVQTRASLLMVCNPIGSSFDRSENAKSYADQVNIPDNILSRCDIKILMLDNMSKEESEEVSGSMIDSYMKAPTSSITPQIPAELLRKHVAYARKIDPELTKEAGEFLHKYYMKIKMEVPGDCRHKITMRQLNSLIHLSEGRARMRLSKTVDVIDAKEVTEFFDLCIKNINTDKNGNFNPGLSESKTTVSLPVLILNYLKEHGGDKKQASEMSIMDALKKEGKTEDRIGMALRKLKEEGKIYEPTDGLWQVM